MATQEHYVKLESPIQIAEREYLIWAIASSRGHALAAIMSVREIFKDMDLELTSFHVCTNFGMSSIACRRFSNLK